MITYLGSAVPVLGLGLAADAMGLTAAVAVFAGLVSAGCVGMAVLLGKFPVTASI